MRAVWLWASTGSASPLSGLGRPGRVRLALRGSRIARPLGFRAFRPSGSAFRLPGSALRACGFSTFVLLLNCIRSTAGVRASGSAGVHAARPPVAPVDRDTRDRERGSSRQCTMLDSMHNGQTETRKSNETTASAISNSHTSISEFVGVPLITPHTPPPPPGSKFDFKMLKIIVLSSRGFAHGEGSSCCSGPCSSAQEPAARAFTHSMSRTNKTLYRSPHRALSLSLGTLIRALRWIGQTRLQRSTCSCSPSAASRSRRLSCPNSMRWPCAGQRHFSA